MAVAARDGLRDPRRKDDAGTAGSEPIPLAAKGARKTIGYLTNLLTEAGTAPSIRSRAGFGYELAEVGRAAVIHE
jgi:hypothetical protein